VFISSALGEMQHGTSFVSSKMTSLPAAVSDKVGGAGWMLRKRSFSAYENHTNIPAKLCRCLHANVFGLAHISVP